MGRGQTIDKGTIVNNQSTKFKNWVKCEQKKKKR